MGAGTPLAGTRPPLTVNLGAMSRRPLTLTLALVAALAGCSSGNSGQGTIAVPPPPTPGAEPSPLALTQPNVHHVHAIATRGGTGTLLVATHAGLEVLKDVHGQAPDGPYTLKGDVLQAVVAPDGTAYAAGHNLGVQVSHDGGATWKVAAPDVAGLDVHGLALDPAHPGTLFAYAVHKGMLTSSDGGAHWIHLAGFADTNYVTGLVVTGDGTVLAGNPQYGISASTDRGSTFVAVRGGTGQVYSLAASATSADIVLAGTENGIFLTVNGGKDWNVGETNVAVTGVGVDPTDPKRFFAGGADGSLSTSTDGGASWQPL